MLDRSEAELEALLLHQIAEIKRQYPDDWTIPERLAEKLGIRNKCNKDGLYPLCKPCRRAEYMERYRGKTLARMKAYSAGFSPEKQEKERQSEGVRNQPRTLY